MTQQRVAVLVGIAAFVLPAAAMSQQPRGTHMTQFNPATVTPFRDSFAIIVQGHAEGWQVYAMEKTDSGFRFTDRISLGYAKNWSSEVLLDSQLRAIRAQSNGVLFGESLVEDVRFVGRHATGFTSHHTDSTPKRIPIDTVLPTDAVDYDALMGLILTLDWHLGATYALNIFYPDQLSITTQILHVTVEELVTVPAGKLEVWRADLTTTEADSEAAVRIWVTATKPHRIVKVGGTTDDLVTVLLAASP